MLLQLKYKELNGGPVNAAFLRGSDPAEWLRGIDGWQIDMQTLHCYVMPQSIRSNDAAGLFVVFNGQNVPALQLLQHPYIRVSGELYIPFNARLYPELDSGELKKLLIWDLQVFHPANGLVGFEKKDEVNLASLLVLTGPKPSDWGHAHPGLPAHAPLMMIGLEASESENILETIKEDVGSKPLSDIPAAEKEAGVNPIWKKILYFPLQVLLMILLLFGLLGQGIMKILNFIVPIRPDDNPGPFTAWFRKIDNWVGQKLQDLQKQRDSELQRLMKLFEQDSDEALQYAIPLTSSYLNRGVAPPSGKLGRRPADFNLRNLGGGRAVDSWDLSSYRQQLKKQYEDAANAAFQSGNFKKAAYVYAHLLGDFYSAANVLRQGKFYREAAAIYRDHIKSNQLAAECLERGGLLNEAIALYLEMGSLEKVGDLYTQMEQPDKAMSYYKTVVESHQRNKSYLHAAKVADEKMGRKKLAKDILLEGWQQATNPEPCLKQYFQMTNHAGERPMSFEVQEFYTKHVPELKKTAFLNVLADVTYLYPEQHLEGASLNIAYEIINQQAEKGDHSAIPLLSKFIPGDRLLSGDGRRYINNNRPELPAAGNKIFLTLRQDIYWLDIITCYDQILAVGKKGEDIFLARANWEGRIEYLFLFKTDKMQSDLKLIFDETSPDTIMLAGQDVPDYIKRKLESYTYFNRALNFETVFGLSLNVIGIANHKDNGFSVLHTDNPGLRLRYYTQDRELSTFFSCQFLDDRTDIAADTGLYLREMYYRKDHFYLTIGSDLYKISKSGKITVQPLKSPVLRSSCSAPHAVLKIALLTESGCLLLVPELSKMNTSYFFATEANAIDIKILSGHRLAVAYEQRAAIYDISNAEPRLVHYIKTENKIRKILSVPKRNHVAFLESDNRILTYETEQ